MANWDKEEWEEDLYTRRIAQMIEQWMAVPDVFHLSPIKYKEQRMGTQNTISSVYALMVQSFNGLFEVSMATTTIILHNNRHHQSIIMAYSEFKTD